MAGAISLNKKNKKYSSLCLLLKYFLINYNQVLSLLVLLLVDRINIVCEYEAVLASECEMMSFFRNMTSSCCLNLAFFSRMPEFVRFSGSVNGNKMFLLFYIIYLHFAKGINCTRPTCYKQFSFPTGV